MVAMRSMATSALKTLTETRARLTRAVLAGLFLVILADPSSAQNLINTGSINNTGLIRVKEQAVGLPPRIDGVFEFFGGNQQVPATEYSQLVLSGSGTKTTTGGSFTITDSIYIASAVALRVESGSSITLNGTLTEAGYLAGMIAKTVGLSGSTSSSNFGNIGATISWTGTAPGSTRVTRGSDSTLMGNGFQSIKRFYDIMPTTNTGLNAALVFKYANNELNGQNPATLCLWRSADNGATWRKQGGTVDAASGTITKTGITSFSLWTAADSDHPLGPSTIEGIPTSIALAVGNNAIGPVNTSLNPFVVIVTDGFGGPVPGVNVSFAITGTPSGASGQSLSVTNTTTEANGQASSVLTLGNEAGTYTVTATSPGLMGSPVTFTATATANVAAAIAMTSGNNQNAPINSTLPDPLVVHVSDTLGNPVYGATITFTITSTPAGATGQNLSATQVATGVDGRASTFLRLGNKVGNYIVTAAKGGLAGSPVTFSAVASPAGAATIALTSGNNQSGTINTTLPIPFVVTVTDSEGNPVPAVGVRFAIVNAPDGAVNDSLSATNVIADTTGRAATFLTLGNKVGTYAVNATSTGVNGSPVTFSAIALHGIAASLYKVTGDSQVTEVNTVLKVPFTVKVTDAGENPVPGATLMFSIDSIPSGASGQSLSVTNTTTEANGQASSVLTLGNEAGTYTVTATSPGLMGSPVTFTATATANVAAAIAMTSGNNQNAPINSTLPDPLVVHVSDTLGNPVYGATITFTITSTPAGATGQNLSATQVTTGVDGRASTFLRLGNKVGNYIVTAARRGSAGSPVTFSAVASPAGAATIALTSGNNQSGTINTTLPIPFVVTVTDSEGNPVPAVGVRFAIVSAPNGATGASLSATNAVTDASGRAATNLTLGNKVGIYAVNATSTGVNGSPVTFNAIALHGIAASLYKVTGDSQVTKVNTVLKVPFTVKVTDAGENPVPGATLMFSIDSIPLGATGQTLSATSVPTDSNGLGSALFTVGNRVGRYLIRVSVLGSPANPGLFTVTAKGTPPQFVAVRDTMLAYKGVRFEHQLNILDPDSAGYPPGTRTFRFDKLWGPSWISLDTTSGLLSGTPGPNDIGVSGLIIKVADNFGQSSVDTFYVKVVNAEQVWSGIPTEFQLLQNYPNPFNPTTTIRFAVPRESKIRLLIYDDLGRKVRTLADNVFQPGRYEALWDSRDDKGLKVGSGMYFYRLVAYDGPSNSQTAFVMTKKMVLVK